MGNLALMIMEKLTKEKAIKIANQTKQITVKGQYRRVPQYIELEAIKQVDWFSKQIKGKFRIFFDDRDNSIWLFAPRATKKGYILSELNNPKYKLL